MSRILDARRVHDRMRAALAAYRDAEKNAVALFAEIMRRKLYRQLGHPTILQYATDALGFSRSKAYEFIRLAESLESLPALKRSVESGKVSWTKAREVVKVATPESEKRWVALARESSRRELEREVARSRAERERAQADPCQGELLALPAGGREIPAAAPPQSLTLRLEPMQRARFDALTEKLMKKLHCTREEVLLLALESLASGSSTRVDEMSESNSSPRVDAGAPYQVIVHRCAACGTGRVGRERRPLGHAEMAQVECDSRVIAAGERMRRSIPPSRRRAVLLRDGHRCRAKGCCATQFLEVHHLRPLSKGGDNGEVNLVTLCASCHRLMHERGGGALALRDRNQPWNSASEKGKRQDGR